MQREGQTKLERPGEDSTRAGIMTQEEVRIAKETMAMMSVQTSMSEVSDDGMNDRLPRETKRLKE